MFKIASSVLAAVVCGAIPSAHAASYPDRPITLIVPSIPGGAADAIGRLVAEGMSEQLGAPIIVENRPGGATTIGTLAAIKARPDGYTLLLGLDASLVAAPYIMPKLPYQAQKDLIPIGMLATVQYVLVASPTAPFRSVAQLLEQARAKPGTITYASGGEGSVHHLGMELLQKDAGVSFKHIPYKAAPQGFVDVMGGHVDMMFIAAGTAIAPMKSHKVQGLASSGSTPIANAPELPALKDIVKGYTFESWFGLLAPIGTPAPVIAKLESTLADFLKTPRAQEKMQMLDLGIAREGADGLHARIDNDSRRFLPLLAKIKEQIASKP